MWVDDISKDKRQILNRLAGTLGLPPLEEYQSEVHFLNDVYGRVVEAGSIARQLASALNT